MKKIISLILVFVLFISFCGCSNMSVGMGNFEYNKIHIDTHHYSGCIEVENWYENESGVEVKTKKHGSIFLSEGTYMMIEDECPFCD